ncbi:MAG: uroporphyrinogen decarboxylase family protein [Anaerolineae bacterium]
MNARERFLAVLDGVQPDRVPTFEILIHPSIIEALCPGCDYAGFVEAMDIEGAISGTPSSLYSKTVVDAERHIVRDEWGVLRQIGTEVVPMPMGGPIATMDDLRRYAPPDPDAPGRLDQLERLLARFRGQRAVGMHVHDSFSYPTYLLGMDKLLMALYLDPDLVRAVIDLSVQHTLRLIARAAAMGADFVLFGDDYAATAGPLMSPALFEAFFLPGLRTVVQAAKGAGLRVIKHSCGRITPLLDMFVDTGINALHPLDAAAGMDMAAVKARYGDRIAVCGGIDCGEVLSDWTPAQVEAEVRRRLEQLAPSGGYIMCSSNSIHSSVKPANYRAMLDALHKYGTY